MTHAVAIGPPREYPRIKALAGIAAVIAVSVLPIASRIAPGSSTGELLLHEAVWWSYAAMILLWLRFAEGLPLSSIALRWTSVKGMLWGCVAALALIAVMLLHFGFIVPFFHLNGSVAGAERNVILSRPFWYRLIMVLRAAVVEEILFRGYLIEKVRQLTGSAFLAVAVSVAAFTYAHLSGWGVVHLIPVCAAGLIFAVFYVWRRDLPANMLAHFITDGIGFLG